MATITITNPPVVVVQSNAIGPQGPQGEPGEGGATLGANIFTGTQNLSNNDLEDVKTASFNAEFNNGISGTGTIVINWENGQFQKLTLTGDCVISISAPIGVCHNQLRLIQDSIGGHDVTWVGLSSNRWLGGSSIPPINSMASGESLLNTFFDGTNFTQSLSRIGTA
jgi:hypothetical protein